MGKNGIYNVAFDNSSEQAVSTIHNLFVWFVLMNFNLSVKIPKGLKLKQMVCGF